MIDVQYQCLSCGRISHKIITKAGYVLSPNCITSGCPNHMKHSHTVENLLMGVVSSEWECVDGMDQEYRDLYRVRKKLLRR